MPLHPKNPKTDLRDKVKSGGPLVSWTYGLPALSSLFFLMTDGRANQTLCPAGGSLSIYRARPGNGISFEVFVEVDGGDKYIDCKDLWDKMKHSRI